MNLLPGMSLLKIGIYAAIILGLIGTGVYFEHGRMQKKLDAEVAKYNQFVGGVAALGVAAERTAALADATNARNKERADEENRKRTAAVNATIRSLRAARDDARRRLLSAAPAGSKCPDGQACFDGADFERAYGKLVGELRAIADEGTQVTTDLNTAKRWATSRGALSLTPSYSLNER